MSENIETLCIHGDCSRAQDHYRAVSYPIYQTSAFSHIKPGHNEFGFDYTRESNPTRTRLEDVVSSLEGGADTVAFASGMAAITAVFELLGPGDRVVSGDDLYGGTARLDRDIGAKHGLEIDYVDTGNPAALAAAVTPGTKLVYIETPTNPMMHVTDISAAAALAHGAGALLAVDNTFLSPYFQNPLALGADLVIHSGSKFLAGHNDVICGFVCAREQALADRVRLISKTTGGALAPFDAWLTIRGIKTLAVRMERQQENAMAIAAWLRARPEVTGVYYIGLAEHPGYAVNRRQARGSGSMISFRVADEATALRLLERVRLITFAESLGGTETLLTYPMVQTHPDVPPETRERLGITETLLRLSVGLEKVDDLIADLQQALEV